MKSCCVPGCHDLTSKRHRFPLDPDLFQEWLKRVNYPRLYGLTQERIYRIYAVCDRHFAQEDMAPCSRTGLRRDAVPTLLLPEPLEDASLLATLSRVSIDLQDNNDPQLVEGHELLANLNLLDAKLFDITETTMPYLFPSNEMATSESLLNNMNNSISRTDFTEHILYITAPEVRTADLVTEDQTQDVTLVNYSSADALESNENCELLQKPYFKSVKSLLLDTNQIREVCRICFRFLMDEETIKLYEEMLKENGQQIKTMLQLALPDLDLEIYPDIVICTKCAELIEYSFHLKELWLTTEKKLQKIIEKKKGMINRNADLLIVGKTVTKPAESVQNLDHMYAETPTLDKQNDNNQEITDSVIKILLPCLDLGTNSIHQEELKLKDSTVNPPKDVKKIVDPKGPYICEKCGRIVKWKGSLIKHLRSHANESRKRPYKKQERKCMCETCGQLFTTTAKLARHYRIHGDHKCPICKKEFTHNLSLQKHLNGVHLHKLNYQCHFCGKRFSYASSLRLHLITHNPHRKVLSCNICHKKFALPAHLRKHMRKHSNEKFSCEYCGKSVRYKESLDRHILIFHLNKGEWTCDICGKPYWKKYDLKRHKIQIHGISSPTEEKVNEDINAGHADFPDILQLAIDGISEVVI